MWKNIFFLVIYSKIVQIDNYVNSKGIYSFFSFTTIIEILKILSSDNTTQLIIIEISKRICIGNHIEKELESNFNF